MKRESYQRRFNEVDSKEQQAFQIFKAHKQDKAAVLKWIQQSAAIMQAACDKAGWKVKVEVKQNVKLSGTYSWGVKTKAQYAIVLHGTDSGDYQLWQYTSRYWYEAVKGGLSRVVRGLSMFVHSKIADSFVMLVTKDGFGIRIGVISIGKKTDPNAPAGAVIYFNFAAHVDGSWYYET